MKSARVPEASKEMILQASDDESAAVQSRCSLFSFQGIKSGLGKNQNSKTAVLGNGLLDLLVHVYLLVLPDSCR